MANFIGDSGNNRIIGTNDADFISGRSGDDDINGREGNDIIRGDSGFDFLSGGFGQDRIFGGTRNDLLFGNDGSDSLYGDDGRTTLKGADFGSDYLSGGEGNDRLYQSDGNDTMRGDEGRDAFFFKWSDPSIEAAVGTARAFTTIADFNADEDRLLFDVAGVRSDSNGANFIGAAGRAGTFFSGDAAASDGEDVMVITDQSFATGAEAVIAAQNENTGDFVIYFNSTVGVASLLYVDSSDVAHSIARFGNIGSLNELRNTNFSADDFIFV